VISSLKKLRSHTLRLRLDYEGPAEDAPSTVILKMGHLVVSSALRRRTLAPGTCCWKI